jgi:hypothetical protein
MIMIMISLIPAVSCSSMCSDNATRSYASTRAKRTRIMWPDGPAGTGVAAGSSSYLAGP